MRMISRRKIGWSIVGNKTKYYFNKPSYFNFNKQVLKSQILIYGIESGKNYQLSKVKHLIDLNKNQIYTLYNTITNKNDNTTECYYDDSQFESITDAASSLLRRDFKQIRDTMDFHKKYDDCEIIVTIKPYTFECNPGNYDLYIKLCSKCWKRKKYKKKDKRTKSNKYYTYFN